VRKAKDKVFGFLSFLLPGEIERLKISKPLYNSVGRATSLAEISATVGGVAVYLDRDLSSIIVRSSDQEKVKKALQLVEQKIKDADKLAYVLQVSPAEAWLIPLIIGKNGNRVQSLQKDSACGIDVSKESRTVTVTGDSEEDVIKVREALTALVEKARRENVFVSIPENAIPSFVGKGGKNIKEFSAEHGVELQRMRKGPYQLKIIGDEAKAEAAQRAIEEWVAKWEQANGSLQIPLEKQLIPAVVGRKGETARSIQQEFGCRIDVDRESETCTVRGGSEEKRENTIKKIQEIIAKEKEAREEAKAEALAQKKESSATSTAPTEEPKPRERSGSSDSVNINGEEKVNRTNEFPSQPVGVKSFPKRNGKKNKQVDASVQQGTEAGRNLFNLLVSDAE
jgi:polyribonucleotide nucleotidyltransferase